MKYKYVCKIVTITSAYILNETGQIANVTIDEVMLHSFLNDGKYTFIQLYTCLATVTGKTYNELDIKVNAFATENKNFDIHAIVLPKYDFHGLKSVC